MLNFDYPTKPKTILNHVNCQRESCNDCDICKTILENLESNKQIKLKAVDFISYCKDERNNFVRKFWELCGNDTKIRVMAEDLIIAYDQLLDRAIKEANKFNSQTLNPKTK